MAEEKKEVATEQQNVIENGDKKVETNGDAPVTPVTNGTADETNNVEPVKEMRSIVVNNFGSLKSVKVLKKPEPAQPGDGEVLIRVQSAGLSFNDLLCRQGSLLNLPKPPFSLGFEASGLVEAVGANVDLKVGDRVACLSNTQCWSELVLVNSKYVYKLPENIDFDNAVALTLNYVFAHYLLFEVANLRPNQIVFIQSCAGGVGQALVQLASTVENVKIIGTASKHKHEKIAQVEHLFDHSDDYVTEIKKSYPDGVNLVLDCLYGDINKGFGLLKALGHYVLYGSSNHVNNGGIINSAKFWWQSDKIKPVKLFEEHNKTISGFNLRQFLYQQNGEEHVRQTVEKVYNLFLEGKIKPSIDSRYAFEDVNEAMLRLQDRQNIGKVILDVNLQPKVVEEEPQPPKKSSRFSTKLLKKSEKKDSSKTDDKKEKSTDEKSTDEKSTDEKSTDEKTEINNDNKVEVKDETVVPVSNGEQVAAN